MNKPLRWFASLPHQEITNLYSAFALSPEMKPLFQKFISKEYYEQDHDHKESPDSGCEFCAEREEYLATLLGDE